AARRRRCRRRQARPAQPQAAQGLFRPRHGRGMSLTPAVLRDAAAMRAPRAILFDWDNTLVDSWATIHEALNFLMRAMDKPEWSLAETRERVRLSLRDTFPILFGQRWEEAQGIYLDMFREIHLDRLSPLPGRVA